jgi:hypothetical protein
MTILSAAGAKGIVQCLRVIVGVIVNPSRRNNQSVGIDGAGGGFVELAYPHDLAVCHRHVTMESRRTRAINHSPVFDK